MPRSTGAALALLLGLLAASCGGEGRDGETEATATETGGEARAATETGPGGAPREPRDVTFAPDLDVDLDAMERRESGLYVQVLERGEGPRAEPGDSMWVHYTVWFSDGRKLDSSLDRAPAEPLAMVLGETPLIAGWTEGVSGMREGERRRLVVPYDLAYGAEGRPGVPPYSTLVFELELARLEKGGGS